MITNLRFWFFVRKGLTLGCNDFRLYQDKKQTRMYATYSDFEYKNNKVIHQNHQFWTRGEEWKKDL